jgi:hypothetical protein
MDVLLGRENRQMSCYTQVIKMFQLDSPRDDAGTTTATGYDQEGRFPVSRASDAGIDGS